MGAGDWADALVSAYCSAGPSLAPLSLHACHSMLDTALQVGCTAPSLQFCVSWCDVRHCDVQEVPAPSSPDAAF